MKINFSSDYTEGTHSSVLEKLCETNMCQTSGYGEDVFCEEARNVIKEVIGRDDSDVHFVVGGTQANTIVIKAALRPYQGVISASTGHINAHETGAIEAIGHKIISIPSVDGTIKAEEIEKICIDHINDPSFEHVVQPAMVYISFPTENGTLYSKKALSDIYSVCKKYDLTLFIDGARLGYGLMSSENDLTIKELASLCDVFYIGGTKQGLLFGEAIVINKESLKRDFRYMIKQHGAMFAKGRLLGLQFSTIFKDGIYFDIAEKADKLAMKIKDAFLSKGFKMHYDSFTNQQFPILDDKSIEKLSEKYIFTYWGRYDKEHSIVRFCTSWATDENNVDALIEDIKRL